MKRTIIKRKGDVTEDLGINLDFVGTFSFI